ncbi:MAG: UvrD-helicase domain-containing protein [Firmicutes bacterium]|nr:UvrD-helicase domain-containing protein [Bacillota bacterium]
MSRVWKQNQKEAIEAQGNTLVFASAGSGKTAVLTERVLRYLENGGDITRLVVITFTKASAEELKERVLDELYKRVREFDSIQNSEFRIQNEGKNSAHSAQRTAHNEGKNSAHSAQRTAHNEGNIINNSAPAPCTLQPATSKKHHLIKQIKNLNQSSITTIDGFCLEIFKKHFEDIGVEPVFSILSAEEAKTLFAQAVRGAVERGLTEGNEPFLNLLDAFTEKRSHEPLIKAIQNVHDFLSVQENPEEAIERFIKFSRLKPEEMPAVKYFTANARKESALLESLLEGINSTAGFIGGFGEIEEDYLNLLEYTGLVLKRCGTADTIAKLRGFADAKIKVPQFRKFIGERHTALREEIKNFLKAFNAFVDELSFLSLNVSETHEEEIANKKAYEEEIKAGEISYELIKTAQLAEEIYTSLKKEAGKQDFADIERFALKILTNNDRASEIKNQIDYIFFDEYQDTNRLQESIINKIAKDNVFMVGDPKQAIYKFRFAEPEILITKKQHYEFTKDGNAIPLNDNFRSVRGVLDFVNLVFSELMSYSFGGVDYENEAKLTAGREHKTDESLESVTLKFFEQEIREAGELPEVYRVSNAPLAKEGNSEARYIADKVEEIVSTKLVYETDKNGTERARKFEFKDIAVLLRNNSSGKEIAKEFKKRGIPYLAPFMKTGGAGKDTELLVSLLKVIDNPKNDIPLVAVMRSYFGGFSEEELIEIRTACPEGHFYEAVFSAHSAGLIQNSAHSAQRTAHNEGNIINNSAPASCVLHPASSKNNSAPASCVLHPASLQRLFTLFSLLNKYALLSSTTDIFTLVSKIITETGYDRHVIENSGKEGIEQLNSFCFSLRGKDYSKSLNAFLNDNTALASVPKVCEAVNSVTLLTLHKSKGLEFPIVFMAQAEQGVARGAVKESEVIIDPELGLNVRYRDSSERIKRDTVSTAGAKIKQDKEEKEELLRLMYVGMTRARYHLYITGKNSKTIKPREKDCLGFVDFINLASKRNPLINSYKDSAHSAETIQNSECRMQNEGRDSAHSAQRTAHNGGYNNKDSTPMPYALCPMPSTIPSSPIPNPSPILNKYSVSGLNASLSESGFMADGTAVNREIAFSGTKTADLGNSYHKFMELHDFSKRSFEEISLEIEDFVAIGAFDSAVKPSAKVLHSALKHEVFKSTHSAGLIRDPEFRIQNEGKESAHSAQRTAHNGGYINKDSAPMPYALCPMPSLKVLREKPFILYLPANSVLNGTDCTDKVLVQGVFDMLILGGKENILIDYKVTNASAEAVREKYKNQLNLYRRGAEIVFGVKIHKAYIFVFGRNEAVEVF